ncbi:unnamed protein product [Larinioides sclopetarius]|uniref:Uncharacterized protein n=1 Tax=Larinioides sclopetarius TaxID=280406 RepID=A0AAV1ZWC2_9ARAC
MESQTVDGMRDEYCDFTDEQKEACFNEGMDTILDMYTSYCMSHRTKKQCDRLENFMHSGMDFKIPDKLTEGETRCQKLLRNEFLTFYKLWRLIPVYL